MVCLSLSLSISLSLESTYLSPSPPSCFPRLSLSFSLFLSFSFFLGPDSFFLSVFLSFLLYFIALSLSDTAAEMLEALSEQKQESISCLGLPLIAAVITATCPRVVAGRGWLSDMQWLAKEAFGR